MAQFTKIIEAGRPPGTGAAEWLSAGKDAIISAWHRRIIERTQLAARLAPADLYGNLSKFLDELAWALRPDTPDEVTSLEVCAEHGEQRAALPGYTIKDVLFEYGLLRQLIYQSLETHAPLDPREQAVILNSLDRGLAQAAEKFAQVQDVMQRQFLAVLSHDLRNPLSAAAHCTQLILRTLGQHERTAMLAGKAADNLRRVDHMISDLLDVSRVSFGRSLTFKRERCDLQEIALAVTDDFATQYGKRFQVTSSGPTTGNWSADGLRRLLENLLSNAIKYGYPNTPIRVEIQGQDREVKMSVINHGDSLTPDELAQLSAPYFRSSSAIASGEKGWGLGLAMVRGMVKAHDGQLLIASSDDQGTCFTVILPFTDSPTDNGSEARPDRA